MCKQIIPITAVCWVLLTQGEAHSHSNLGKSSPDCNCPVDFYGCQSEDTKRSVVGVQQLGINDSCALFDCGTLQESPDHWSTRLSMTADCPEYWISRLPGFKSNCETTLFINAQNEDVCLESCLDTHNCRGVTYMKKQNGCYLHDCKQYTNNATSIQVVSNGILSFTSDKTLHFSDFQQLILYNSVESISTPHEDSNSTLFVGVGNFSITFVGNILLKVTADPVWVQKCTFSFNADYVTFHYTETTGATYMTLRTDAVGAEINFLSKHEGIFVSSSNEKKDAVVRLSATNIRVSLNDILQQNTSIAVSDSSKITIVFLEGLRFNTQNEISASDRRKLSESGILNLFDSDIVFIERICKTDIPPTSTLLPSVGRSLTTTKSTKATLFYSTPTTVGQAPNTVTTHTLVNIAPCQCSSGVFDNSTTEEIIQQLVANTTIDVKQTGNKQRQYYSVLDERPSSQTIGYVGIVMLSLVFCVIAIPDLVRVVMFLCTRARYRPC